jgi:hypothetical protein
MNDSISTKSHRPVSPPNNRRRRSSRAPWKGGLGLAKVVEGRVMSALGQKQTFALQEAMSALPPIATAKADTVHSNSCPLRANSGLMQGSKLDRYSITSSAICWICRGTVMPSACAVLR